VSEVSQQTSAAPGAAPPLRFAGAMLSDVGLVRSVNEDSVAFVVPPENQEPQGRVGMMLVADGMGGHSAGEVASRLAAEVIRRCLFEVPGPVPRILSTAFLVANKAILDYAQGHPECAGMGTTCTALVISADKVFLGHVGDSRAYILRGAALKQLSEDQTLVAKMVREGAITAEEARTSEHNNIILQALGTTPEIAPDIWGDGIALQAGDTLIVCSDGLHGLVSAEAIADVAGRLAPAEACQELIQRALHAGGHDNVSVGVIRALAVAAEKAGADRDTRRIPGLAYDSGDLNRATRQLPAFEGQR
jgi:serine/threonine protein phosphatase PrpC